MIKVVCFFLLASVAAFQAYEKANALFQQKKFPESLAAVEEALRLDPNLVPALTLKAKLAMAANRLDVARQSLLRATETEPNSAYAQFLLGFYYYLENDFNQALAPLEKARRLNPEDARAYFYLAMSQEGLGRAEEALALYQQAAALEAKQGKPQADTLVAYARLLFTLGRLDGCAKWIERALAIDPNSRDAHYEQGRLHFENGDFTAAITSGEKALRLSGAGTTDGQIHFLLGRAYLKAGQKERAEEHLVKFRASAPSLRR